jgi:hypothetical protein
VRARERVYTREDREKEKKIHNYVLSFRYLLLHRRRPVPGGGRAPDQSECGWPAEVSFSSFFASNLCKSHVSSQGRAPAQLLGRGRAAAVAPALPDLRHRLHLHLQHGRAKVLWPRDHSLFVGAALPGGGIKCTNGQFKAQKFADSITVIE